MAKMDKYTSPRQGTMVNNTNASGENVDIVSADVQLQKVEDFYTSKKNIINGIAIAIIALPLLWFAYNKFIKAPKEIKAAEALADANAFMLMDSTSAMLNGANGKPGAAKIASQYSGTKVGNLANYMAGAAYLKEGKFKEAIKCLESFDGNGSILATIGTGLLGDAYCENGQDDKAIACYEKAGADKDNFQFAPIYLQRAALLYEKANKADKAIIAYQAIKTNFPQSGLSRDADKSLARLGIVTEQ
jgi:tetratricopeptide (TPR) repeat protein